MSLRAERAFSSCQKGVGPGGEGILLLPKGCRSGRRGHSPPAKRVSGRAERAFSSCQRGVGPGGEGILLLLKGCWIGRRGHSPPANEVSVRAVRALSGGQQGQGLHSRSISDGLAPTRTKVGLVRRALAIVQIARGSDPSANQARLSSHATFGSSGSSATARPKARSARSGPREEPGATTSAPLRPWMSSTFSTSEHALARSPRRGGSRPIDSGGSARSARGPVRVRARSRRRRGDFRPASSSPRRSLRLISCMPGIASAGREIARQIARRRREVRAPALVPGREVRARHLFDRLAERVGGVAGFEAKQRAAGALRRPPLSSRSG